MVVVDTKVIAALYLPESEQLTWAERARRRDRVWAAPMLWRSEFRNVLALYMRRRGVPVASALAAQAEAEALLAGFEYEVDSALVLTLAAESGRTAYDCEFVAVARTLGVRLVTDDRRVAASFPEVAISLAEFAAG